MATRWFRMGSLITLTLTLLVAVALFSIIISLFTSSTRSKSMDGDPWYNNTAGPNIFILIIQFCFICASFLAYYICFVSWRNNYQLDHPLRTKFVVWIFLWCVFSLINLGVSIFLLVRGKEQQEEMTVLYEIFGKYNQDIKFVSQFERYQRENSCCGVYGPDDWLVVQLRNGMGAGGGAGGYQSLDYGFRQNPSTGKCHLTPPTIPMGCGRKILEDLHVSMATIAAIMILQTLVALAAAGLAAYSFFYWLEKEVIVIPEDEVSNLIILEPESSTSMTDADLGSGAYLGHGYLGQGGGPGSGYPGQGYMTGSGGYLQGEYPHPSYLSAGAGGSGSRRSGQPTVYSYNGGPSMGGPPGSGMGGSNGTGIQQAGSYPPAEGFIPPGGNVTGLLAPPGGSMPQAQTGGALPPSPVNLANDATIRMLSAAGPFDAGSRSIGPPIVYSSGPGPGGAGSSYMYRAPPPGVSRRTVMAGSSGMRPAPVASAKKHSVNHLMHAQEKALGGKVLGEMHIDHKKDEENPNNISDVASSSKPGHRAHHATLAIVRNKQPPKPKKLFAEMMESGKGHHGQTGHLAEDIAEMTGNARIIKQKVDDVVLPVEHAGPGAPPGGYLRALKERKKVEEELEREAGMAQGSGSISGLQAVNILSQFLDPVAQAHANQHSVKEEERPLIQAHTPSGLPVSPQTASGGIHSGSRFIGSQTGHGHEAGINSNHHSQAHHNPSQVIAGSSINHYVQGSQEHAHYGSAAGSHQDAHYINQGSHERTRYIGGNQGSHQRAHYINPGSHEHANYIGGHQRAHYLNEHEGQHQHAHYLGNEQEHGQHQHAHYIGNDHGQHQHAHYLGNEHEHGQHANAHYLGSDRDQYGQHQRAHYLGNDHGQHQRAHYLGNDHGQHQRAHYLGNDHGQGHGHGGQHQNAHYLGHGSPHNKAHYLNDGRHHQHQQSHHEGAHYVNHHAHAREGRSGHRGAAAELRELLEDIEVRGVPPPRPPTGSKSRGLKERSGSRSRATVATGYLGSQRGAGTNHHFNLHGGQRGYDKVTNNWSFRTVLLYKNPNPMRLDD